jgi:hypothetical protein
MQDKGIMRVYTELPSWAKGIVVVGGLAIGYIAVTSILNKIKEVNNKAKDEKELNTAKDELQIEIKKGIGPTITRSIAEAMSSAIIEASNDCGTNNDIVFAQFDKVKNQADMLLFVDTFGLRKKVRCPFSTDTRESFWSKYTIPLSLSSVISSELSQNEINKINNKLSSKGIEYRF